MNSFDETMLQSNAKAARLVKRAGRVQPRCAVPHCLRIARTAEAGFGLRRRGRRAAAADIVREHVEGLPHLLSDSVELAAVLSAFLAAW